MPYADAITWLAHNDDNTYIADFFKNDFGLSVVASFVADCYGRFDDEVAIDVMNTIKRLEKQ